MTASWSWSVTAPVSRRLQPSTLTIGPISETRDGTVRSMNTTAAGMPLVPRQPTGSEVAQVGVEKYRQLGTGASARMLPHYLQHGSENREWSGAEMPRQD